MLTVLGFLHNWSHCLKIMPVLSLLFQFLHTFLFLARNSSTLQHGLKNGRLCLALSLHWYVPQVHPLGVTSSKLQQRYPPPCEHVFFNSLLALPPPFWPFQTPLSFKSQLKSDFSYKASDCSRPKQAPTRKRRLEELLHPEYNLCILTNLPNYTIGSLDRGRVLNPSPSSSVQRTCLVNSSEYVKVPYLISSGGVLWVQGQKAKLEVSKNSSCLDQEAACNFCPPGLHTFHRLHMHPSPQVIFTKAQKASIRILIFQMKTQGLQRLANVSHTHRDWNESCSHISRTPRSNNFTAAGFPWKCRFHSQVSNLWPGTPGEDQNSPLWLNDFTSRNLF